MKWIIVAQTDTLLHKHRPVFSPDWVDSENISAPATQACLPLIANRSFHEPLLGQTLKMSKLIKFAMDIGVYPCRRRGREIAWNGKFQEEPQIGQVQFRSVGYWHVGVYIGDGEIIHFTANREGTAAARGPGCIRRDSIKTVASMYDITEQVDPDPKRKPNDEDVIIGIAWYLLENPDVWGGYNVATHNCENFAHQCIYEKHPRFSDQTKGVVKMVGGALVTRAAYGIVKALR